MTINTFKIEEYLSKYEFNTPYLLCCSDAESISMQELLALADPSDLKLWQNLHLGYTEVKGSPNLRKTIVNAFYPDLTPDHILCFSGAEEGIFCTLSILCEPEDHVIVLTPCYQSLQEIPKHKGCQITAIALSEQNSWRIEIEIIKQAIKPNTKCVIINFPHNPTGQVIDKIVLQQLIELLTENKIWLFSDEVYRLLGTTQNTNWAGPVVNLYSQGISLGVMSKAFGMAGLRVGWIACRDLTLLKRIEQLKCYTSICNSAPSEVLSIIALKNKDQILARNNNIVASNLRLLDQFFTKYKQKFSWVRPAGGCIGFVNYNSTEHEHVENLCNRLVATMGVLLLPASIYDLTSNHFRIGFGRKNMPEALLKFKEFLEL